MHIKNMHLVWKKISTPMGRKTHKRWPSKNDPNTIEIYIKNIHKTTAKTIRNLGQTRPGRRKNPSRSRTVGTTKHETCNHGRKIQKLHALTRPQSVDHGLEINSARPKREDLKALTKHRKRSNDAIIHSTKNQILRGVQRTPTIKAYGKTLTLHQALNEPIGMDRLDPTTNNIRKTFVGANGYNNKRPKPRKWQIIHQRTINGAKTREKNTTRHWIIDSAPTSKSHTPKILESQIHTWESSTTKQNTRINKEETDLHNVNMTTNNKEPPTRNQAHEGKGPWETR